MRKKNLAFHALPRILLAANTLAVLAVLASGCESESVSQTDLRISPAYAEVSRANPSVTLTASGWSDYRWAIASPNSGYLSSRVGDSVVYTATTFSATNFTQVITVTADRAGSGTNAVPNLFAGTARVRHR